MRLLAYIAVGLAFVCQLVALLLAMLVPFTVGVSGVLLPVPIVGFLVAVLMAFVVRSRLSPGDPLQVRIDGLLHLARIGGKVGLGVLALLVLAILVGVVLGLLGFPRLHSRPILHPPSSSAVQLVLGMFG